MSLDYLKNIKGQIDLETLSKIHRERENWKTRKASEKYQDALDFSWNKESNLSIENGVIKITSLSALDKKEKDLIYEKAKLLKDWKKGPFQIDDMLIDAEWRCDFKWNRIKESVGSLEGHNILDIGCNNGHYMYQMLEKKPRLVMGIDPVPLYWAQFEFIQKFFSEPKLQFELFGVSEIVHMKNVFDTIFSMGIIYHHRNPIAQLIDIRNSLAPGGQLIIETIGIPGEDSVALFPTDRYANMGNVWFFPTLNCLINWLEKAKFVDIEVISTKWEGENEQRNTLWCDSPSYQSFLDPNDSSKTIEGYPAPKRFCLKAKKKKNN